MKSERLVIKIGSSPLDTPEFIALKTEFNKLSHPARPEVNWTLIDSLCLSLFKNHGIDLQSGAYYTIARLQQHGLSGFTEGCELLASIIVTHWDTLWPEKPNQRTEVFNWFNTKASALLRQQTYATKDLRLIYRSERALQLIIDKLAKTTWEKLPKIENLLWFFQNLAKQIEKQEEHAKQNATGAVTLPPLVYIQQPEKQVEQPSPTFIFETPEPTSSATIPPEITPKKMSAARGFMWGCILSSTFFLISGFSAHIYFKHEIETITSIPEGAVAKWLFNPDINTYEYHLALLEKRSPLANLKLIENMQEKAKSYWPTDAKQTYFSRNWQNQYEARLENMPINDSWSETGMLLQQLSNKIVQQEKNRGSFTLSYLKTAIYEIQKQHNKVEPIEEKLRQLSLQIKDGQSVSPATLINIDNKINGLLARYYELQKQAEQQGLKPGSYSSLGLSHE
ncbi:VasL domain-containing protein [Providencia sp. Me31A]|uniref:VasL domain-containing protein n=1 Tax=Providencia sp. Me31A TaxID=3392637 RepID=UPI003D2BBDB0